MAQNFSFFLGGGVCFVANIRVMPYGQKSAQPLEEGVLIFHRQKHTDGHGNPMTESAQWTVLVKSGVFALKL